MSSFFIIASAKLLLSFVIIVQCFFIVKSFTTKFKNLLNFFRIFFDNIHYFMHISFYYLFYNEYIQKRQKDKKE